jgi:hypothetical protein
MIDRSNLDESFRACLVPRQTLPCHGFLAATEIEDVVWLMFHLWHATASHAPASSFSVAECGADFYPLRFGAAAPMAMEECGHIPNTPLFLHSMQKEGVPEEMKLSFLNPMCKLEISLS